MHKTYNFASFIKKYSNLDFLLDNKYLSILFIIVVYCQLIVDFYLNNFVIRLTKCFSIKLSYQAFFETM